MFDKTWYWYCKVEFTKRLIVSPTKREHELDSTVAINDNSYPVHPKIPSNHIYNIYKRKKIKKNHSPLSIWHILPILWLRNFQRIEKIKNLILKFSKKKSIMNIKIRALIGKGHTMWPYYKKYFIPKLEKL